MAYLTVYIKYKLREEVWAGSIELVIFEIIGKIIWRKTME